MRNSKGQFVKGHTYKHTEESKKKLRECKLGDKNPNWKGDDVGKTALHLWFIRNFKKPKLCQRCKKKPPYDLANISGEYKRDFGDWEWLCRRCHMKSDGRLEKFKRFQFRKKV